MDDGVDARDVGAANLRFARALLDELHAAGVAKACICPGSRSAPLALAAALHPGLTHSVHVDERSAAFHALGWAKAAGCPVLLIATSGTAGANFLPAVAEACQARVPLVVLTADRPPELRAWGAAQTMEQRTLFAGFTRWSEEAPCPSERPGETGYARALARRAVLEATGPAPGPVHLNLPFREPLLPATMPAPEQPESGRRLAPVRDQPGAGVLPRELAIELHAVERGVLVFGPDEWDPGLAGAAVGLATELGWPVLADAASGLRAGCASDGAVIHGADLLLGDAAAAAALQPDLIVRFGGMPTSAAITAWMKRHVEADVWLVDPAAGFRDPQHRSTRMLRVGSGQFCTQMTTGTTRAGAAGATDAAGRRWLNRWLQANRLACAAADVAIESASNLLAPRIVRELWRRMPEGAALYAANSMAIRDLDRFATSGRSILRVLANRGVNGIDGQVSAALGAAAALGVPTVLWCGDLALLHDVAGLLAGRLLAADLTIVVSNDDGGGIFEYLPAARLLPRGLFEPLFAVPHGLDLAELASGLGWQAARVASVDEFAAAFEAALGGGRHLIEVRVDRAANTALHEEIRRYVGARLAAEPIG